MINIHWLIKEYHQLLHRLAAIEDDFYTDLDGKLCHLCDIDEARPEYLTVTRILDTIKKLLESEEAQEALKNFPSHVLVYIPPEVELEALRMSAEEL
ncbi:MAG: hypothetical protein HKM07_05315 [Chlamydiae bacterium]|nr:hypothetical protein [Chlamydiota bacterium]